MTEPLKLEKLDDIEDNKHSFAFATAGKKTDSLSRPRVYDRAKVREFLKDPIRNYEQLQNVSDNLNISSGIYFRMLKYLIDMLTFDHWIYPTSTNKKVMNDYETFWKEYESVARKLERFNIKYNCRWWMKSIITHGEVYLYKVDDGTNIVYTEFPSNYCRIAQEVNGVLRFEIDLNRLNSDTVKEYPSEIRLAWEKDPKRKKKASKNKLDDNRSTLLNNNGDWYLVSDKGVAFSAQYMQTHGYPFMISLFDDLMRVEDAKDETENSTKANNFKLIHNKIPIDKDTKKPIVNKDTAQIFHNETKNQVPDGVGVSTNVFDVTPVTLQNRDTNAISMTNEAESNLWSASGFSQGLFSAEKATGEGIKKSTITDEMMMFPFLKMFGNYFNEELKNNVSTSANWSIHFINSTFQNISDLKKEARENMAFGGNRLEFIATCGETPFEFIKRTQMEQTLRIDEFLTPKLTAHTLSSSNTGRLSTEDSGGTLSENGEVNREYK